VETQEAAAAIVDAVGHRPVRQAADASKRTLPATPEPTVAFRARCDLRADRGEGPNVEDYRCRVNHLPCGAGLNGAIP